MELRERLLAFMDECVYPAEETFREQVQTAAEPVGYAADHRGAEGRGARAGSVEPVPAGDATRTARA